MNMYIHKLNIVIITLFIILGMLVSACKKKETTYYYEVPDAAVTGSSVIKPNQKSTLEYVSILYADLMGQSIPQPELTRMVTSYEAFGDDRIIEDLIIRNLLNRQDADIPTTPEMRANPTQFVDAMYQRFLVRKPNDYERMYWVQQIQQDTSLHPDILYYAVLTSVEYRHY